MQQTTPYLGPESTAQMQQTRFVLVSGPLGAGKTTLINSLLEQYGKDLGKTAVIVNDFGKANIDASRIRADAIRGLDHECVCCGSKKELARTVSELDGSFDTVIIEPTGVADPRQIRSLFEEQEIPLHTIGLLDAIHLDQNDALGLQAPTIEVASQVFISRTENEDGMEALSIPEFAESYVREIRNDLWPQRLVQGEVPLTLLNGLLHDEGIEHGTTTLSRKDDHAPGHAFTRLTIALYPETTIEEIAIAVRAFSGAIERAKGYAADGPFDIVHGDLSLPEYEEQETQGKLHQMILISSATDIDFRHFTEIGIPPIPSEESLQKLCSYYPDIADTIGKNEEITPHFEEADAAYAKLYPLANAREEIKNPETRETLNSRWRYVLAQYLGYRVQLAQRLQQSEVPAVCKDQESYLKRETGLILAWHAMNYPDDISTELHDQIRACKPCSLFLEGYQTANAVSDLAAHSELSLSVISEVDDVVAYGRQNEEITTKEVLSVFSTDFLTNHWDAELLEKLHAIVAE